MRIMNPYDSRSDSQIPVPCFAVSLEIPRPITETAVIIPESNWLRLVSRIKAIEGVGPFFHTAAGALAGFMFSAFIAASTLPRGDPNSSTLFMAAIALLVCTALCSIFAYRQKQASSGDKSDILDEMRVLRNRFIVDQEDST